MAKNNQLEFYRNENTETLDIDIQSTLSTRFESYELEIYAKRMLRTFVSCQNVNISNRCVAYQNMCY